MQIFAPFFRQWLPLYLVMLCVARQRVSTPSSFLRPGPLGSPWECQALAPPAAGVLRAFDPVRVQWVRLQDRRPPSQGEDTPIHRAMREIERVLESGEPRQALTLLQILADDLVLARHGAMSYVLDLWHSRFPSELPLVATGMDLDRLDSAIDTLFASPAFAAIQTPADAFFIERIWRTRFQDPESPAVIRGFESNLDLEEALSYTLGWEAHFIVRIPQKARRWVENRAAVPVGVRGLRKVGWVMNAMEDLYPRLKGIGWHLRIDGKIVLNPRKAVHPTQRLVLVLSRSA